ncbi:MarR family winged helix-turn-helix transcriptional regulator [Nocardia sp. alder85J]|uniref:MarR family winged helix-turn-helix transcriptional regulator n=1 Tax=Nocardia sp. alder85J TaxID=2862949 RepID=UPI001CD4F846|nr:MarR family transcriptional regulator [Nocardia sp. alder85J]MCX4093463.1 MarR family transcriptional regulator [Nocardia sp. alder85J]
MPDASELHLEGLLRFPSYAFGKLHRAVHQGVGSSLRDHWVLVYLEDRADRISQQEIADALGIDRSEVVRLVDGLERAGLVIRQRDTVDRRKHCLSITEAGRAARLRVDAEIEATNEVVFARLTPEERDTLHRLSLLALGYDEQYRPLPPVQP